MDPSIDSGLDFREEYEAAKEKTSLNPPQFLLLRKPISKRKRLSFYYKLVLGNFVPPRAEGGIPHTGGNGFILLQLYIGNLPHLLPVYSFIFLYLHHKY